MDSAVTLQKLTEQFRRMPGIGAKTAMRMSFYVLSLSPEKVHEFADAIINAGEKIHRCLVCCNLTDETLCPVCDSDKRDKGTICVVENVESLMAIENTNEFGGVYHVLHGVISPMDGVSADDLTVKQLISRVASGGVNEVIIATGSGVEGELTAMYLYRAIQPFGIKVSRIAYGVPVDSDLQYADTVTLSRALSGRTDMSSK